MFIINKSKRKNKQYALKYNMYYNIYIVFKINFLNLYFKLILLAFIKTFFYIL